MSFNAAYAEEIDKTVRDIEEAAEAGFTLDERKSCYVTLFERRHDCNTPRILAERTVGDRETWVAPDCDYIALGKAIITNRTGLWSRVVVLERPELLLPGERKKWGSALVGVIGAAISGLVPDEDQSFSYDLARRAAHRREQVMNALNERTK